MKWGCGYTSSLSSALCCTMCHTRKQVRALAPLLGLCLPMCQAGHRAPSAAPLVCCANGATAICKSEYKDCSRSACAVHWNVQSRLIQQCAPYGGREKSNMSSPHRVECLQSNLLLDISTCRGQPLNVRRSSETKAKCASSGVLYMKKPCPLKTCCPE